MSGGDGKKKALTTIPQSSPLFPHPSDNPGIMITQTIFRGDNYDNWADAVRMGLDSKNKLTFLEGKVIEPTLVQGEEESVEHVVWRIAMVKGWLRNVIDEKLHASISFSASVKDIWTELKERYARGNAPRIHQLKFELTELKQGRLSVVEYYTKLKTIWDELTNYSRVPKCTCGAEKEYHKEKEDEKVHQFLMGLDNDAYGLTRSSILREEPTPTLSRVYAIMLVEESHQVGMRLREDRADETVFSMRKSQPSARGGRPRHSNEAQEKEGRCSYCNKWGHDEDDCWTKHGPPAHITAR